MRGAEEVGHRALVEWKPSPDLVDICLLVPVLEPHPDSHAVSEGSTVGSESSDILVYLSPSTLHSQGLLACLCPVWALWEE